MNVYIDTSVLLRVVLGEQRSLSSWAKITRMVASELVRTECLRTLDRLRLRHGIAAAEIAERRADTLERLRAFDLVPITAKVLERAQDPFGTSIGTLDAIHLTSALLVRARYPALLFATHDDELAVAARAEGFTVIGQETKSARKRT